MSEQLKGEKNPVPETIERQKYLAFQAATKEVDRITEEIDRVLATTPDRAKAEEIVLEKYIPQMDEAMKKDKQALDEWLDAIKEDNEKE